VRITFFNNSHVTFKQYLDGIGLNYRELKATQDEVGDTCTTIEIEQSRRYRWHRQCTCCVAQYSQKSQDNVHARRQESFSLGRLFREAGRGFVAASSAWNGD
jgi:hypothetical protein